MEGLTPRTSSTWSPVKRCGRRTTTSASTSRRTRLCSPSGRAHGRRHPECPPLWRASLQRHLTDGDHGVQADHPKVICTWGQARRSRSPQPGWRSCGALHDQALWRESRAFHWSESVSDVPLLEPRRSSLLRPVGKNARWVHSTNCSFVHHVLNNIVKQSWPSSRLTRWRSRPRSVSPTSAPPINVVEQHLPDYVDLTPELGEHYLSFTTSTSCFCCTQAWDRATACCQVKPSSWTACSSILRWVPANMLSQ